MLQLVLPIFRETNSLLLPLIPAFLSNYNNYIHSYFYLYFPVYLNYHFNFLFFSSLLKLSLQLSNSIPLLSILLLSHNHPKILQLLLCFYSTIYHLIVLDESGSMSCVRKETIEGCNNTLKGIRQMQNTPCGCSVSAI